MRGVSGAQLGQGGGELMVICRPPSPKPASLASFGSGWTVSRSRAFTRGDSPCGRVRPPGEPSCDVRFAEVSAHSGRLERALAAGATRQVVDARAQLTRTPRVLERTCGIGA